MAGPWLPATRDRTSFVVVSFAAGLAPAQGSICHTGPVRSVPRERPACWCAGRSRCGGRCAMPPRAAATWRACPSREAGNAEELSMTW